jgi:uncharacterized protein (UPF0276 family)
VAAHVTTPAASDLQPKPIPAMAGVGLRFPHHAAFLCERPAAGWLEVHTENYMGGSSAIAALEQIRRDYPVALHGVGLSLGSAGELDLVHLARIAAVARRIEPGLMSEHLSWSVADGAYLADLLPLPLTEEALDLVCDHIDQAQEYLGQRLLLENPSSCFQYAHSTISEPAFLAEVARRTGCGILCDVNNIYVSARNNGWSAEAYLQALPTHAVAELHLAGHSLQQVDGHPLRIDDHGSPVCAEVWALYRLALERFGCLPTLIEWDSDVPPLQVLLAEAVQAQQYLNACEIRERHAESV